MRKTILLFLVFWSMSSGAAMLVTELHLLCKSYPHKRTPVEKVAYAGCTMYFSGFLEGYTEGYTDGVVSGIEELTTRRRVELVDDELQNLSAKLMDKAYGRNCLIPDGVRAPQLTRVFLKRFSEYPEKHHLSAVAFLEETTLSEMSFKCSGAN
jgi:hypothetical protein